MAAAHVFVADLESPVLDDDDRHHLGRVLRLRPGEQVTAADGAGGVRTCAWTGDGIEPVDDVDRAERAAPLLTVAFAVTKGDKPEWVVQKLTECGVDRIVLLAAARSVVRWDPDKALRNVERLRKVAREAAMQSRRRFLPDVTGIQGLAEFVRGDGVALAEMGGERPSLDRPAIAIGPEGGWSDDELALAPARVSLGSEVYRAETAAVAAGVLLGALRQRLVI